MKNRKAEIATLLTIGALVVIGITAFTSSFFLNQKKTTNSKATVTVAYGDWDAASATCKEIGQNNTICICSQFSTSGCDSVAVANRASQSDGKVCIANKWDNKWGCWLNVQPSPAVSTQLATSSGPSCSAKQCTGAANACFEIGATSGAYECCAAGKNTDTSASLSYTWATWGKKCAGTTTTATSIQSETPKATPASTTPSSDLKMPDTSTGSVALTPTPIPNETPKTASQPWYYSILSIIPNIFKGPTPMPASTPTVTPQETSTTPTSCTFSFFGVDGPITVEEGAKQFGIGTELIFNNGATFTVKAKITRANNDMGSLCLIKSLDLPNGMGTVILNKGVDFTAAETANLKTSMSKAIAEITTLAVVDSDTALKIDKNRTYVATLNYENGTSRNVDLTIETTFTRTDQSFKGFGSVQEVIDGLAAANLIDPYSGGKLPQAIADQVVTARDRFLAAFAFINEFLASGTTSTTVQPEEIDKVVVVYKGSGETFDREVPTGKFSLAALSKTFSVDNLQGDFGFPFTVHAVTAGVVKTFTLHFKKTASPSSSPNVQAAAATGPFSGKLECLAFNGSFLTKKCSVEIGWNVASGASMSPECFTVSKNNLSSITGFMNIGGELKSFKLIYTDKDVKNTAGGGYKSTPTGNSTFLNVVKYGMVYVVKSGVLDMNDPYNVFQGVLTKDSDMSTVTFKDVNDLQLGIHINQTDTSYFDVVFDNKTDTSGCTAATKLGK